MEPSSQLRDALIAAGLLPAGTRGRGVSLPADASNLLPALARYWDELADEAAGRASRRGIALRDWLVRSAQRQAVLAPGVLGNDRTSSVDWLSERLTWWPRGIPPGQRIGLVSSRLGRNLDRRQAWFTVLRAACAKVEAPHDVLLTAKETTTARFIQRCGELFGLRVIRLEMDERPNASLAKWARQIRNRSDDAQGLVYAACLSPRFDACDRADADLADIPHRDRAVVALSDRLIVLHARRGGHQDRLLRRRLADSSWPVASVLIALGPGLVERALADELMGLGAVGWLVFDSADEPADDPQAAQAAAVDWNASPAPIIPLPSSENWKFLTHCTRRRIGPWPDQDERAFLDDLILERGDADHSPLAALQRIIDQRRIVATCRSVRGEVRVVSLTEVPLGQLSALRAFRAHRGHWDFEPYGLCLRRDWLTKRGARAVTYGDEELWNAMPERERTFFQLHQAKATASRPPIDWSVEREWRCVGDINLAQLPTDAGLVFVSSRDEAEELAKCSRWPITVVPQSK